MKKENFDPKSLIPSKKLKRIKDLRDRINRSLQEEHSLCAFSAEDLSNEIFEQVVTFELDHVAIKMSMKDIEKALGHRVTIIEDREPLRIYPQDEEVPIVDDEFEKNLEFFVDGPTILLRDKRCIPSTLTMGEYSSEISARETLNHLELTRRKRNVDDFYF